MKKIATLLGFFILLVSIQACKKTTITADFGSDVQSGLPATAVQFTDLSTISSGSITSWLWDFGDGQTSTEKSPSHTYSATGNYNVSLTVKGKDVSNTKTKESFIVIGSAIPTEKIIEIKTSFGTMYMCYIKKLLCIGQIS